MKYIRMLQDEITELKREFDITSCNDHQKRTAILFKIAEKQQTIIYFLIKANTEKLEE